MRNGFRRINCIFYFVGGLLEILSLILLFPLIVVFIYWGHRGDGWVSVVAFSVTAFISLSIGLLCRILFRPELLDTAASMLICVVGWLSVSVIGALPFIMLIGLNLSGIIIDIYDDRR